MENCSLFSSAIESSHRGLTNNKIFVSFQKRYFWQKLWSNSTEKQTQFLKSAHYSQQMGTFNSILTNFLQAPQPGNDFDCYLRKNIILSN